LEDLVPERKRMGESVLWKILTEVGVKMATQPWGRMRGEIPRRE
jgi:hypothetical protein